MVIEEWEGDDAIRIPDEVLQELGVDVGDYLYLVEECVGSTRFLVFSSTQRIPDRILATYNCGGSLGWALRRLCLTTSADCIVGIIVPITCAYLRTTGIILRELSV